MDPVSLVLGLAEFIPSVIGWFSDDDGENEKKANGILDIAKKVTGITDSTGAMTALKNRPELIVQFKESVLNFQLKMEQENSKQIESVNKTMRAEAKSEHWMQWAWRPFNGFAFGITIILGYIVPALVNIWLAAGNYTIEVITAAPFLGAEPIVNEVARVVPIAKIPEFVLVAWGAILGVTSWTRGTKQTEIAKQ